MPVVKFSIKHTRSAANIHAEALEGDFLPGLGRPFLETFYKTGLQNDTIFGFVYYDNDHPEGFIIGCEDSSIMFRRTLRDSALGLGWKALPAVLRNPGLILKMFETFRYPEREDKVGEKAELLVIGVRNKFQGRGIGSDLVRALDDDFTERGIDSYKVSVLKSREGANKFYQRLGFKQAASFSLYRKDWLIYVSDKA